MADEQDPLAYSVEGLNPTRRYRGLRPRQAYRGSLGQQATNYANIALFNSSTGALYLVVRGITVVCSTDLVNVAYRQGHLVAIDGIIAPMVPGSRTAAGVFYRSDASGAIDIDFQLPADNTFGSYFPIFPFAVIPPGWSLQFQPSATGATMQISAIWEEIAPEELDYADF